MNRAQLEHILRAAAGITGGDRFVVIGSQALLGQFPSAPPELLRSMEADLFSLRSAQESELIDGSIGENSLFHRTFGYFAHGVGPETATLPSGWEGRLVPVCTPATGGATGLCLEVHDLAASKIVAGREKDLEYVSSLLRHQLVRPDVLRARIEALPISASERAMCAARLTRLSQSP